MAIGIPIYGDDDNQMTGSRSGDDIYRRFLTYFKRVNQLYRDRTLTYKRSMSHITNL
jgi:hypothetical protein